MNNIFIEFKPLGLSKENEEKNYFSTNQFQNNLQNNTDYRFSDNTLGDLETLNPGIPWLSKKTPNKPKTGSEILEIYQKSMTFPTKKTTRNFDLNSIPKNQITNEIINSAYNNEDKEYLLKLAKRESSYKPGVTNPYGYYGLYQFGKGAFKETGYTKSDFRDTTNQHNAALKLAKLNESYLKNIIAKNVGKVFNGINITKNGIRAAAHLLGANTVKNYFNGVHDKFTDKNGTNIESYLKMYE